MSITTLKQKLEEYNSAMNALRDRVLAIQEQASIPSFSKEEFQNLSPKEKDSLFAEKIEEIAESIPAQKIQASKRSLKEILEAKRAKLKQDEFSSEASAEANLGEDANILANLYGNEHEQTQKPTIPRTEEDEKKASEDRSAKGLQESFSLSIILNDKQLAAKEMALAEKSFVLIGAAGTGKTTTQRSVAEVLVQDQKLTSTTFKSYNAEGERHYVRAPSIAFCAYTRRAAANLAKAILKSPELEAALPNNIMTIHSLLEYEPETYWDPIELKDKFRFSPKRTASNPLDITHLIIEESSMLGLDLWEKLYDALPEGVQIIFIGDINQLPPVFGPSILNYALVQLPIVELTEVYRNQGIVLENAHNILKGKGITEDHNFQIIRGKSETQVGQSKMAASLAAMFEKLTLSTGDDGLPEYDPENCIILSPFNKQDLGTDNMNKWIAQFVGAKRNAIVHEIIAGFNKLYLAEGDKIMFNKRDGVIKKIEKNPAYYGKEPQIPGTDLTRFGVRIIGAGKDDDLDDLMLDYSSFNLEDLEKEKAERKMQASHTLTLDMGEGRTETVSAAGDFQPAVFSLGYCLTIHKAQGSEWRKVFILLHKDHSIMAFRELFYTAVTRARTKVTIIAKDFMINKAIATQRIKGDTVKDKIEYFNSGINDLNNVVCVK